MRLGEAVSLQRMKAWWAYSEIRSPLLTEEYRIDPRVPPCRQIFNSHQRPMADRILAEQSQNNQSFQKAATNTNPQIG
jgi:hypothetical protein